MKHFWPLSCLWWLIWGTLLYVAASTAAAAAAAAATAAKPCHSQHSVSRVDEQVAMVATVGLLSWCSQTSVSIMLMLVLAFVEADAQNARAGIGAVAGGVSCDFRRAVAVRSARERHARRWPRDHRRLHLRSQRVRAQTRSLRC
eukprot:4292019-Pleurochrysis_carterae.AAC.2